MYRYLEKNTHDKSYPYTISDAWGGKCYMTEEGLKALQKEIEKALNKQVGGEEDDSAEND